MAKDQPLVSVVMSCFNSEKSVRETIESILAQTYCNFEFIIWDDGSTDSTRAIVESFKDERIRYFYHENTGLGMALRLACAEAKGKYIARMDADDISLTNRLATEVEFLEKNEKYVLVSSAVYYINEDGIITGRSFPCNNDNVLKGMLPISSLIVHPMVMMRKSAYEKAGGYIPIRYLEDILFWNKLAGQGKFYNIPTPLGKYRMVQNSLGHSRGQYEQLLFVLRKKMLNDTAILESDIELYNNIYLYSKQFKQNESAETKFKNGISKEERLFKILRSFLGEHRAEGFISRCKNIYYKGKMMAI